jgi:hypothetical protein
MSEEAASEEVKPGAVKPEAVMSEEAGSDPATAGAEAAGGATPVRSMRRTRPRVRLMLAVGLVVIALALLGASLLIPGSISVTLPARLDSVSLISSPNSQYQAQAIEAQISPHLANRRAGLAVGFYGTTASVSTYLVMAFSRQSWPGRGQVGLKEAMAAVGSGLTRQAPIARSTAGVSALCQGATGNFSGYACLWNSSAKSGLVLADSTVGRSQALRFAIDLAESIAGK